VTIGARNTAACLLVRKSSFTHGPLKGGLDWPLALIANGSENTGLAGSAEAALPPLKVFDRVSVRANTRLTD
jgi:hypothetical protein